MVGSWPAVDTGGVRRFIESSRRVLINPADRRFTTAALELAATPETPTRVGPDTAGILSDSWQSTLIAEFNDLDSARALFEQYPEQIAGVIIEPIRHNVGALLPTTEFINELRDLATEHGAVLIFDEVITGFRHALGGYQQICGVTPDLTTFGKALGNGYPVAGRGGRRDLMQQFDAAGGKVSLLGTFNGNPTSCAAAIATIEHLRNNPDFYPRTHALGQRWRSGLRSILYDRGIAAEVAGFGGTLATYFIDRSATGFRHLLENDTEAAVQFHRRMIDRGVPMVPLALKRNHVSGSHTAADIDLSLSAPEDSLAACSTTDC